ncbi:TrmH family RNA methyltransferase [Winogradskyella sp. A2]|uniref:TrmH family RNA methyltransferase n=1 Tax=Winogradskyella sp. A2 TaxID=3366944 RepID=UPI00398C7009
MLSKNQIKLIKSLGQKKHRQQEELFIVEGIKGINEFLNSEFELDQLYTTQPIFEIADNKVVFINENQLKRISSLKNPNTALAIFKIPESKPPVESDLTVVLDDVRDPGNLGTIIRLCDWYGIRQIICSTNTVDCFNQKVVQATMGSLTRVNIYYTDLRDFLKSTDLEVLGTFMNGENIYTAKLPEKGLIILGNEANGISIGIEELIDRKITIPQFGDLKNTESLNVANATAIVLSEFKRRFIEK